MSNKATTELLRELTSREAAKDGWEVHQTRSTHYRVFRHGKLIVTLAGSGGRGRGIRNALAALRRAGFTRKGER
jgi:hypothetical protein